MTVHASQSEPQNFLSGAFALLPVSCLIFAVDGLDAICKTYGWKAMGAIEREIAIKMAKILDKRDLRLTAFLREDRRILTYFYGLDQSTAQRHAAEIIAQMAMVPISGYWGSMRVTLSAGGA